MRSAICHISVPSTHRVMQIEAYVTSRSDQAEQHAQGSLAGSPWRLASATAHPSPQRLCVNATFCGSTALRKLGCWPFASATLGTILTGTYLYLPVQPTVRDGVCPHHHLPSTAMPFSPFFGVLPPSCEVGANDAIPPACLMPMHVLWVFKCTTGACLVHGACVP